MFAKLEALNALSVPPVSSAVVVVVVVVVVVPVLELSFFARGKQHNPDGR